ncbi:MAG TPA: ABC transporter substrate-binding protein, partial [Acidimicrobiales bacterium]|nr:ABC transporter substrate-binding protein [Acidimicrobiales bacterium]
MRRTSTPLTVALAALSACSLALAAACGDDDDTVAQSDTPDAGTDRSSGSGFPAEVAAANGTVTIAAQPERIVSLSATATEMIYAIGAGDQVVAVDDYSNYPEGTPMTDLSGFEPNVEAVTTYDPDLVVVHFDANDVIAGLERLDIPVLELPAAATLDESYEQIEQLGLAAGHADEAGELVDEMQADIEDLVAHVPERDEPLTYYHELDDQLHTATSRTFVGQVYALAGLENVADAADDGSGYPQVSAELLLDADPDMIFLADGAAGVDAASVAARPGWDQMSAVTSGRIVELDPDISSRWGPRTVDFLRTIVKETADVE